MKYHYQPKEISLGDLKILTTEIESLQKSTNEVIGSELIPNELLETLTIDKSYAYCLVRKSILVDKHGDEFFNNNSDPSRGLVRHQIQDRSLIEAFLFFNDILERSLEKLELNSLDDCFCKIIKHVGPYYFDFVASYSEEFLDQRNVTINHKKLKAWLTRTPSDFLLGIDDRGRQDTPTSYRGIELNSPGHKRLCEKLASKNIMFMLEAATFVPGDKKNYRKVDLVVVKDDKAVIVEIDGSTHLGKQREDDYLRDAIINEHWSNHIRFSHREVQDDIDLVFRRILKKLDRNDGNIRM